MTMMRPTLKRSEVTGLYQSKQIKYQKEWADFKKEETSETGQR